MSTFKKIEVPLAEAYIHESNVRHNVDIDEDIGILAASIGEHGLLQPVLAIKTETGWGIVAGRRRFFAVLALTEQLTAKPKDRVGTIAALQISPDQALDMSLAENYARQAMKPVQVYRAFAQVMAAHPDMDEKGLASAFGLELDVVRRTLRLGRIHPTILEAHEKDDRHVALEDLKAFAATEDQDMQLQVFESLGRNVYARAIKAALGVSARDFRLQVVGLEAYKEAGGRFEQDLFETHANAGRILDPELLDRLSNEKLTSLIADLTNGDESVKLVFEAPKDRWGTTDYNLRLHGEMTIAPEIEQQVDKILVRIGEIETILMGDDDVPEVEGKDEDQVLEDLETEMNEKQEAYNELTAKATWTFPPGRKIAVPSMSDNEVTFTIYWADKDAKKDYEKARKAAAKLDIGATAEPDKPAEKNADLITQRADQYLAGVRKQLIVKAIGDHQNGDARDRRASDRYLFVNLQAYVHATSVNGLQMIHTGDHPGKTFGIPACVEKGDFDTFAALDPAEKERLASQLLACLVNTQPPQGKRTWVQDQFGTTALANTRSYWTPDAEFFDIFKKSQIIEMVAEVSPRLAKYLEGEKVASTKTKALAFFAGTASDGRKDPTEEFKLILGEETKEALAKAKAFVPKWLRMAPPEAKKPKAAKPKAPAKKAAKPKADKVPEPA